MFNGKDLIDNIRDAFSADLPALLTTAGLDDFAEYLSRNPYRSDDLELCVYLDAGDNSTDTKSVSVIIQAQLYKKDSGVMTEYNDVIYNYILDNITESFMEYEQRDQVTFDVLPMDNNTQTSFLFYGVTFSNSLDDCS